ncbi:MAG TPA: NADH-quinone oxidoreductase subunit N, partial [Lacipirellulaceae bacterium]|nr:NADH-quinone oxidoreductase subunit N [Lacipirellulaceae bacterium]
MSLPDLVNNMIRDTLDTSVPLFLPELVICGTIVVLLLARLFRFTAWVHPFWIALAGSAVAFWYALPAGGIEALGEVSRQEIFTRMLVYDSLTVFFRLFLLAFAILFVILVRFTGLADRQDGQDFYSLLLGATLGMCLMASANHLMTVFLAVEMASVPSYVMSGILKGRRRAGEAALKYAVYGAGAAGVMLYGISLLAGLLGTAHLPTIATRLVEMDIPALIDARQGGSQLMVLALAALMIMVGLAFKLSAVPFHFWCPDVFEGAPAEVDAFLSVASKGAAMALLLRVVLGVTTVGEPVTSNQPPTAQQGITVQAVALQQVPDGTAATTAGNSGSLSPVRTFLVRLLAIVAAVTCTFGNLAAYGQSNIKRLLAYSTIAHAGYMIMAVAAAVQLVSTSATGAAGAIEALLFYLAVYVFMNLGAFAIVAFLRNELGSEEIADYAGLIRSAPVTSVALTVILVSLIGLPPLAGFIGKFYVFCALVVAGGPWMIGLLVIAGINTAISLVY